MIHSLNNLAPISFSQILEVSQSQGAQALMLSVQAMMTKEFDNQLNDMSEKLEFLSDVKEKYREKINKVYEFMSQSSNTSRNDGKIYYEASFSEMHELLNSLTVYEYDVDKFIINEKPLSFSDDGETATTTELRQYFHEGSKIHDSHEAKDYARQLDDDDGTLPFYFGHTNNEDKKGLPKVAFYQESIEKMLEQIENAMTDVEEVAEKLSLRMGEVSAQRKSSLEGYRELLRKIESVNSYIVQKSGR